MNRIFCSLGVTAILLVLAPVASGAQDSATPDLTEQRDPAFCGAGGAGCDPTDVQQWKAIGNGLADLSSADLSQYAYACAKHADWRQDCETDPVAVLKRLGIEGY
ncbi:hypothetical protein ELG97_36235 (plasmid) [Rhizobium leguminosarum]|uniref:hypothetical protein n=1 Tax=Rhizobium leguminosarum TaxID=384 RepID=UPI001031AAC2|nr:hypothetical protein [Rhizobium leguminosarum]MBY5806397.1 hypothetical protein [Rhizobium leguminosarum]TBE73884.1 hypothetical protein ELG97_36235 [Rhizobium leguminosarum]